MVRGASHHAGVARLAAAQRHAAYDQRPSPPQWPGQQSNYGGSNYGSRSQS